MRRCSIPNARNDRVDDSKGHCVRHSRATGAALVELYPILTRTLDHGDRYGVPHPRPCQGRDQSLRRGQVTVGYRITNL